MENIIKTAWGLALDQRRREKEEYYGSGDQRPAEQAPSLLPDAISLEMVSPLTQPRTRIYSIQWLIVV